MKTLIHATVINCDIMKYFAKAMHVQLIMHLYAIFNQKKLSETEKNIYSAGQTLSIDDNIIPLTFASELEKGFEEHNHTA